MVSRLARNSNESTEGSVKNVGGLHKTYLEEQRQVDAAERDKDR